MTIAKGKITIKKSGNGGYKSVWLYIPSKISKDNSFPFNENEEVLIEIEDGSLVISKNEELAKIVKNFGIDNATLPKLLEIKADKNGDKPFLYFKDQYFSYVEINRKSNQIAHGIMEFINKLDLKKPHISIMMGNCPEYIFTWFGIIKAGCIFIPINLFLNNELIEYVLTNSDTDIIITDYKYFVKYKNIFAKLKKIKIIFIHNAPENFNFNSKYLDFKLLNKSNLSNPKIYIYDEDLIEILYTGGRTGKPKGIVKRKIVLSGIAIGYELKKIGLKKENKIYCTYPLYMPAAQSFVIIPSLFYDVSVIISDEFSPSTFWEIEKKYKPDGFCYFRGYLAELLHQTPNIMDRTHSLRWAYGAGADIDIWNAFEKRFGIPLYECWGHLEGIGVTINRIGSQGGKTGSVGTPINYVELKIMDSEGKELFPGRDNVGEIAVKRKYGDIFEYYKVPENTDVRIDENGWMFTGDYGYRDYDGFVYFKGKKDEIINIEGDIILTRDIERIANSHPHILETAVIPISNKSNPKIDLKLIAKKVKNRSITHEELSDYLYHNLAYYQVPRYIEFKDELTKGPGTELLKEIIRQESNNRESRNNTWDTKTRDFLK